MTARRGTERQQVALEIYRDLDEKPPWEEWASQFMRVPRGGLSDLVRNALRVSREDQASGWGTDDYAPFRGWRSAVEKAGILLVQEGPLPVSDMRGFASIEPASVPRSW